MRNISKAFPGVQALSDVTFKVRPGTVHALMGENGAGKSTLMKCLFGIYKPDEGDIYLNGSKVTINSSRDALNHGISMIHQELHPVAAPQRDGEYMAGKISDDGFLAFEIRERETDGRRYAPPVPRARYRY